MDPIHVSISRSLPLSTVRRIAYALGEIGARAGLRFCPTTAAISEDRPTIAYGLAAPNAGVNIRFEETCWSGSGQFHAIPGSQGRPLWCNAKSTRANEVDPVGGVFRLLTLADEAAVAEMMRDRRGNFVASALPSARLAQSQVPLVEYLVTCVSCAAWYYNKRAWPRFVFRALSGRIST
jgi:hypothetical protein